MSLSINKLILYFFDLLKNVKQKKIRSHLSYDGWFQVDPTDHPDLIESIANLSFVICNSAKDLGCSGRVRFHDYDCDNFLCLQFKKKYV